MEELQRKLRAAANTMASDVPGHGHVQQAPPDGQGATAPSQPALRADCSVPQGTGKAPVNAASSRDIPPELAHAKVATSSPDPAHQVDAEAAIGSPPNAQQSEDRVGLALSESAGQLGTAPAAASALTAEDAALAFTKAAEQQTKPVVTPSATHTPTPRQVAAESPEQPVSSALNAPAAIQSSSGAQQPQVVGADGLKITRLPGLAEPSGKAVSNQAALHESSVPMQSLLGLSSVTPLPPPVLSPTRATPNALTAAPQSPMGPLPETGQSGLLGWTAVTPFPPPILSPTAAQGQASAARQTSSSPASSPATAALTASDVGQQTAHATPLPAQISALPTHTSAASAQATPVPAQASPLLAQVSPLPGASASLHTVAGDTPPSPQQLPAAAPLQSPCISVAAVHSAFAKEAGACTDDHDNDLIDAGAPGEDENGGAGNALGATSQPVPGDYCMGAAARCVWGRGLQRHKGGLGEGKGAIQGGKGGGGGYAEISLLTSCWSPGCLHDGIHAVCPGNMSSACW